MKLLLTGILLMSFMTCYLMGNVGHFPLPHYLLLPDKVIIEYGKDHYLWVNVMIWALSYISIYWAIITEMLPTNELPLPSIAPASGCIMLLISVVVFGKYYADKGYYTPLIVEIIIVFISGLQGYQGVKKTHYLMNLMTEKNESR